MKKNITISLAIIILIITCFGWKNSNATVSPEKIILDSMSLEEKLQQMFIVEIPTMYVDNKEIDFTKSADSVKDFFKTRKPGGVILYKYNMVTPDQTKALTNDIQSVKDKVPFFICTNEEGGRMTNVPVDMNIPSPNEIGKTGDSQNTFKAAETIGLVMKDLGLNLNLAPVMDVNTNPKNPVIGNRAFSSDPLVVAEFGVEFIKGLRKEGILSTAKHFPGHGDTFGDSTKGYVIVPHKIDRLMKVEIYPFIAAIKENVDFIMVGHIIVPALDETRVPASLSKPIVTNLLKNQLGFNGVVISDSLIIAGITAYYNKYEAAKLAINSGNDMILRPDIRIIPGSNLSEYDIFIHYLVNEVENGNIKESRINDAVLRILQTKSKIAKL